MKVTLNPRVKLWSANALALVLLGECFTLDVPAWVKLFIGLVALSCSCIALAARAILRRLEQEREIVRQAGYSGLKQQAIEHFATADLDALTVIQETPLTEAVEASLLDWPQLPKEATGLYLLGDPGSGKTCSIIWLLGLCTQVLGPAQVSIVDLHNKRGKWPAAIPVIDDGDAAIHWMQAMLRDLENRRKQCREGATPKLHIWVVDEVGALSLHCKQYARKLKRAGDKVEAAEVECILGDFLIGLGSQGRKYNYLGIAANQAANTGANGMEGAGDYLESYHKIFLGRVALKWAKIQGIDRDAAIWLNQQAYPCLVGSTLAKHPTHGDYPKREKEQPPIGLMEIRLQSASVPVTPSPSNRSSDSPEPVKVETKIDSNQAAIDHLKRSFNASNQTDETELEQLSEPLEKLVKMSHKSGWISASIAKQKSRFFKDKTPDDIRGFFRELIALNLGAVRGSGDGLEWCIAPSD